MLLSRLLLSGALIGTLSVDAQSADLPSRVPAAAPSSAAPVFSWTGFYAGGNIGAGWKRTAHYHPAQSILLLGSTYNIGSYIPDTNTSSAIVGGLQAGYDHQIGSWVLGVQANVEATSITGTSLFPDGRNEKISSKVKAAGSFTGRVGYVIQPSLLAYAKGGTSWTRLNYSDGDVIWIPPYSAKASATHWGWTVGAGLEYALTSNWSTFIEYNHANYGSKNVTVTNSAQQNSWYYKFSHRIDMVMVGVNYRFGK